jgi:hypothetical protein
MNHSRSRSDDVLFISAFAAVLLGVALLLYTTGTFEGALRAWPVLVMAAGGALLYLALVRRASFYFLFGGLFFVLEGAFFLVASLMDWQLAKSWPLCMAFAGVAGLVSGTAAKRRLNVFFAVPSICFIFLGLVFALFSLGFIKVDFRRFIAVWWPSLLIAGGISLFVAYGISNDRANGRSGSKSSTRSRRDRGPSSGP